MTEQEIITYLKQNKTNGVGFSFMPEDVQKWCKSHKDEPIFLYFSIKKWEELDKIACSVDTIYTLSEDYEPPKLHDF